MVVAVVVVVAVGELLNCNDHHKRDESAITIVSPYFCFVFVCRVFVFHLCVCSLTQSCAGFITGSALLNPACQLTEIIRIDQYILDQITFPNSFSH